MSDTQQAPATAAAGDAPPEKGSSGVLGGRYRWIVMAVVLGGSYLFVLDLTVLGVALPAIADDLAGGSPLGIDWVITAYVVAIGVVQPATGWMADRWGKKHVYLGALATFTGGSLLAGLAPNLELLVAFRVLQGLGGGVMQPVGMAMIYEHAPAERRGNALGIWGVAIMAAPALGPPLGGWLTTAFSWRWIFLINLPLGAAVLAAGWRLLREIGFKERRSLDWRGWLLAGAGVFAVVLASRQSSEWGVTAPVTLVTMAAGLILLGILVFRSLGRDNPIIEFEMFSFSTFSISITLVCLLRVAQFARLTFLPVELQVVRGLSPDRVGLLLAPGAIGVAATMWLGGWLTDRIGARVPVATGLTIVGVGTWMLARLTPTTPESHIVGILVFTGIGTGLSIMPNSVAAMNSLPTRFIAQAAAVRSVARELATAVGTAGLAAFLVVHLGAIAPDATSAAEVSAAQAAYNNVFLITLGFLAATWALAFFLPGKALTKEHQAARAAEQQQLLGSDEAI